MKRDVKDTHIYFPVRVLAGIKKVAKANRRSVSAEMVIAAERHIDFFNNQKTGERTQENGDRKRVK